MSTSTIDSGQIFAIPTSAEAPIPPAANLVKENEPRLPKISFPAIWENILSLINLQIKSIKKPAIFTGKAITPLDLGLSQPVDKDIVAKVAATRIEFPPQVRFRGSVLEYADSDAVKGSDTSVLLKVLAQLAFQQPEYLRRYVSIFKEVKRGDTGQLLDTMYPLVKQLYKDVVTNETPFPNSQKPDRVPLLKSRAVAICNAYNNLTSSVQEPKT